MEFLADEEGEFTGDTCIHVTSFILQMLMKAANI